MADYHHKGAFSRGGRGRLLSRFHCWATPSDGVDAMDRNKRTNSSSFLAKADQGSASVRDHVCKPVLFGHHKDDGANGSNSWNAYRVETSYMPTDQFADHGRSSGTGFHGSMTAATAEPTVITAGGWTRPSRAGWALPPHVPLEKATYVNSAAALEFSGGTGPRSYASKPNKTSGAVAVIDSREAAKKYGGQFTW